jgi:hypothetical protein
MHKHEGEEVRLAMKGMPKKMGDIATVLGLSRQGLNHHLRKERLEANFERLIGDKLNIYRDESDTFKTHQNLTIVKNGKHALPHTAKSLNIPVPQFAEAGDNLLSHFLPVYDLSNQKEILLDFTSRQDLILFYYSLPDFKDCPLAIIMVGNEMANLYKDGDKLLIDPYDKSDVIFGRPYLIFTKKFVVVRYIHTTKNEDIWLLKAENPRYDEFTINTEKIDFLFQVKGHVSRGCY